MRKFFLLNTITALFLAACGSTPTAVSTQASEGELPVVSQLLVGTMKLEDTDQAVTAEQATELLPMWQVYQELLESDTAAQAEIDGLVEQIQETMSSEQMQAIEAMNLTQQDIFSVMQENNVGMTSRRSGGDSSSNASGGRADGGGPPDGGSPDGGGRPDSGMGGGMTGTTTGATDRAENTDAGERPAGGGMDMSAMLIDALIEILSQKVS